HDVDRAQGAAFKLKDRHRVVFDIGGKIVAPSHLARDGPDASDLPDVVAIQIDQVTGFVDEAAAAVQTLVEKPLAKGFGALDLPGSVMPDAALREVDGADRVLC